MERLDKILASQGLGSRKEVGILIRRGLVQVNGRTANQPETKVNPEEDTLSVAGKPLRFRRFLYLMMNKPAGVVSASRDPKEKTVVDLVPQELSRRNLFPAGRLDRDTTGLLILTDDGEFAHRMLSPQSHVVKFYEAWVDGPVGAREIEAFQRGVTFADGTACLPAGLSVLVSGERSQTLVELREGKYHQVKKMFLTVDRKVLRLKRMQIGGLKLDKTLEEGKCRELTEEEKLLVFQGSKYQLANPGSLSGQI